MMHSNSSMETDREEMAPAELPSAFHGRLGFALIAFVILHFVIALAYAFQTPYLTPGKYFSEGGLRISDIGAPDEREHANYVLWLVDGHGLPVFSPKDPDLGEHYEFHQPPLYYLYEAAIGKFSGLIGLRDLRATAGGRVLRTGTAILGALNVLGVFFLAYWALGRSDVALAAACFVAFLPMSLALSGAISNDPMLFCLSTWCLAVTALAMRQGWTLKLAFIVGLLMGLACLTRTTGVALIPAVLIGAYLGGAPRPSPKAFGLAAVVALILVLPWWARNELLYGDPLAMKAFNQAFVNSPTRTSLHMSWGRYISAIFNLTWMSFIGIFGYMDIPLPEKVTAIAAAVLVIFALGAVLALGKVEWKYAKPEHILNGCFIGIVVLMYIAFNLKYFQAQARYLYPAIGSICTGLGLGLVYFSKEKWRTTVVALAIVLVGLNLWIVTYFLPEQFALRSITPVGTL